MIEQSHVQQSSVHPTRVDETSHCLDRARVYRALAGLFRPPDAAGIRAARERDLPELCQALHRLEGGPELVDVGRSLCELLDDADLEQLLLGWHAAFDESSATRCKTTEMDQLDGPPQLELTRNFEMADVAGFYRAFGVEVGGGDERPDHVRAELEFMNLLAVKETIARQEEDDGEHAEICLNASRAFLRDHLGRFAIRLGDQLAESASDAVYRNAGRLLAGFVALDLERIDAAGAPGHRQAMPTHDPFESS